MDIRMKHHFAQSCPALDVRRVREIMRIACIGVAVELEGCATEALEDFINEKSGSAVCRVKDNAQLLFAHMNTGNDGVDISVAHVDFFIFTRFALRVGRIKQRVYFSYIVRLKSF